MTETQLVRLVSHTLARRAGWFNVHREGMPLPMARILNNPGMLNAWRRGTTGEIEDTGSFEEYDTVYGGFIVFPDEATGWNQLWKNTRNRIVMQHASAMRLLAARDDKEFLDSLTHRLGIQPSDVLANLITESSYVGKQSNARMAYTHS